MQQNPRITPQRKSVHHHAAAQIQVKFGQALAAHQSGQLAQAQALYEEVLKSQPAHFDALHLLGVIAAQTNNPLRAVELIGKAISINPNSAAAYSNRGNALKDIKQYQAALQSYDKAIALAPGHADTYYNRGMVLQELKQKEAALQSYDKAIALEPGHADAFSNRGNVLHELGQYEAAMHSYAKAIALNPRHAEAYYNRAVALQELKQYEPALHSYDRAIALNPGHADAYANRGVVLQKLARLEAALQSYDRAIALNPGHADAHISRGVALHELMQPEAALQSYDRAIALNPAHADAYANRAVALLELKQYEAALHSYDQAIALKPGYPFLHGARLHTKMHICDWSDFESQIAQLFQKIQRNEKATSPFPVLAITSSLSVQRKAAEIWVKEKCPASLELPALPKRSKRGKIRIGYFSADFRNHAVSILMAELFEIHDRAKFEVYAFSFGPVTQDEMRKRLESAFDGFIDVRNKSDREIAMLARDMEIDIAMDLGGHTQDSRAGIFAMRAAPVQVGYAGYLGTMGAGYIDYLIADAILVPENSRQYYLEKIAYLPCYQVNDTKRKISDRTFSRAELGLPETGFVFCSFNNNYKITPATFDSWMRILKQVEGSVLFLYADNESAAANLRREAVSRGVDADRLVFGKRLPPPEYLARYRAADLFLDTLPYNAGVTASDALWSGLPVLTCTAEAFASRMAASLLNAIDLPELIASTQEEYEALAIQLAAHPERLGQIRQKLERNRFTTPLFDTRLFAKHIEDAYTQMYERYCADLPPEHIYPGIH